MVSFVVVFRPPLARSSAKRARSHTGESTPYHVAPAFEQSHDWTTR